MAAKLKDCTGTILGLLTVVGKADPVSDDNAKTTKWLANCICGKGVVLTHRQVIGKKKNSCGCGLRSTKYQPGNKYGLLTIVSEGQKVSYPDGSQVRQVWCRCDCGNPEMTLVRTNNLQSGNTSSCGCVGEASRKTHGLSNSRTYQIHEGMLRRCRPDLAEAFPYHAGRGIEVCERWNPRLGGSFENFYEDMGPAPEGMSLDRIDVNGNYEKSNCRWASNSVQGYNKALDPNNTSGKSGVSFYTAQGKWSAEIHVENQHIRLGMFINFEDAVAAREAAELKYYGWTKE